MHVHSMWCMYIHTYIQQTHAMRLVHYSMCKYMFNTIHGLLLTCWCPSCPCCCIKVISTEHPLPHSSSVTCFTCNVHYCCSGTVWVSVEPTSYGTVNFHVTIIIELILIQPNLCIVHYSK